MKRAALITLASLALFVGWTQNTASEWFKGIIYAGSGKIQLTDATGNLMSAGSFSVSGNESIGGTLAVTGATTLRSTLSVTGAQTNASTLGVGGALGVTGAATLRSTLAVTSSSTLSGPVSLGSTLTGASGATIAGSLDVSGAASFASPTFKLTSVGTYTCTGTTQGTATSVTSVLGGITGATGVAGCVLPAAVTGLTTVVGNTNASIALKLYPASGDAINNSAANTAITVSAGKSYACGAIDATTWLCAGN